MLPEGLSVTKQFSKRFVLDRGIYNFEKKIISLYGYHEYDENLLISYFGKNYKDSTILNFERDFRDRVVNNFWVVPSTDSLLVKTGEGNMFIFHPLRETLARIKFIDDEKIANFAFSPNNRFFVRVLLNQGIVEIRKTNSRVLQLSRSFPDSKIKLMAFTPSGKNLVLSDGNKIWNWDIEQDTVHQFSDFYISNKQTRAFDSGLYVHLLTSGKLIFQNFNLDNKANNKVIDLYTGQLEVLEKGTLFSRFFKSKGKMYFDDRFGTFTNLLDQEEIITFPQSINGIASMNFSPKGNLVGLIHGPYGEFTLWNVKQKRVVFSKTGIETLYKAEIDLADSLIALSSKNLIFILDAKSGAEKAIIPIETGSPRRIVLQFSYDSRYLFINCPHEGLVIIWDLLKRVALRNFSFKYDSGYLIGISQDNQFIYGAVDGSVFAYNQQGKELYRLQLKERDIDVEYFLNDHKIIVASNKGVIYQIDAQSGNLLKTIYLGNYQSWIAVDQDSQVETSYNAYKYIHYRTKGGGIGLFPEKKRSDKVSNFEFIPALLKH
ncbi:WD40 repeat domain-containing protein [Haliscomenobacter hydrossis]|uniref:WD40 repeat-containing protein n=1 Tax=Haliscomenobacter hydrossis (strain ATCC 27775 / DSM 1100 / LMG 10767 / O) TaxID=760192 RepID=F4KTM4_HALH1|nr:WD40 repeat domain-containing protein [Haliscomenobacter hydrossis]AEE53398.1 hypothetical protein Halhy_5574 [Haliscomenobacter hydrossis DSM 1100]